MALQKMSVTIEEFEQFIARTDNLGKRFELINGEIVEKMPTILHAYIINMLAFFITLYLQENPIGYSLIEGRYQVPNTDNDILPDLSFQLKERGPIIASGPAPYMPDLAVEAQSEGQSDKFMADKAKI